MLSLFFHFLTLSFPDYFFVAMTNISAINIAPKQTAVRGEVTFYFHPRRSDQSIPFFFSLPFSTAGGLYDEPINTKRVNMVKNSR